MLKKYQRLIAGLLFAIIGLGFGYGIGKLLKGSANDINIGLAIIPIAILVLWLVLATHELGHLLGGRLAGFRFHLYAVGPLRIDRVGEILEVKYNRTPSLWGGIAASAPYPDRIAGTETLRKQMLLVVAGGPIASLLGILSALPARLLWTTHQHLAVALTIFAIGSFCIAFATMLPIGNSGFVNDGARILQLLRRDEAGIRWMSSATLGALAMNLRPSDWPAELIEATTRSLQPSFDGIMAMWFRYSWHLDRKEIPEAKHWLDQALAHVDLWPAAARPIIHSSAADFYARIEPDLNKARDHLKQAAQPGFITKEALALTEANVLIAEGNLTAARAKLNVARKLLQSSAGSARQAIAELIEETEAKTH